MLMVIGDGPTCGIYGVVLVRAHNGTVAVDGTSDAHIRWCYGILDRWCCTPGG